MAIRAAGLESDACWCAAITVVCGVWRIFEVIPLAATALIPFAVFPLVGILSHREVASAYGHTLILLMLARSILSTAMEKSGAHRRIAIGMVRLVGGGSGRRLVLGFLLASAVLSMWVSNTATVLMLLPVALAVLDGAKLRAECRRCRPCDARLLLHTVTIDAQTSHANRLHLFNGSLMMEKDRNTACGLHERESRNSPGPIHCRAQRESPKARRSCRPPRQTASAKMVSGGDLRTFRIDNPVAERPRRVSRLLHAGHFIFRSFSWIPRYSGLALFGLSSVYCSGY